MDDDMPDLNLVASDIPDIEKVTSDEDPDLLTPDAAKATLTRRFAWDTTNCPDVPELLGLLGLTVGSEEGQRIDHAQSHQRLNLVAPLEQILQPYAYIMGVVLATSMTARVENPEAVDTEQFAHQTMETILYGGRAIIAHLMATGLLAYGPNAAWLSRGPGFPGGVDVV